MSHQTTTKSKIKGAYCLLLLIFLAAAVFQPVSAIKGTKIKNKIPLHTHQSEKSQENKNMELHEQEGMTVVNGAQSQDTASSSNPVNSNTYSQQMIALVQKHADVLKTMYFDYFNKLTNKVGSDNSTQILLQLAGLVAIVAIWFIWQSNKLKKPCQLVKQSLFQQQQSSTNAKQTSSQQTSLEKQREQDELFYAAYAHNLSSSMEECVCVGESSILSQSDYKLAHPNLDILKTYQDHANMVGTFPVLKLNQEGKENVCLGKSMDKSMQLDQNHSQEIRDLLKDNHNCSFLVDSSCLSKSSKNAEVPDF